MWSCNKNVDSRWKVQILAEGVSEKITSEVVKEDRIRSPALCHESNEERGDQGSEVSWISFTDCAYHWNKSIQVKQILEWWTSRTRCSRLWPGSCEANCQTVRPEEAWNDQTRFLIYSTLLFGHDGGMFADANAHTYLCNWSTPALCQNALDKPKNVDRHSSCSFMNVPQILIFTSVSLGHWETPAQDEAQTMCPMSLIGSVLWLS